MEALHKLLSERRYLLFRRRNKNHLHRQLRSKDVFVPGNAETVEASSDAVYANCLR
jgi:hypothetical protein